MHERHFKELEQLRELALAAGGAERVAKQHEQGKLTARERIDLLLDEGSFEEFDAFKTHRCQNFGLKDRQIPGDGVVTGYGTISGKLVYVYSQDFTVLGGSLSETSAEKICKIMDLALKNGAPVISLNDSGGARIQEGIESMAGYADVFFRNVAASGVVPQISCILGPCAGGAVYSPAITDFVVMVEHNSYMFVTGPKVVRQVAQEEVDEEILGGSFVHTTKSGVCHRALPTEVEAFNFIKALLSYLPQNNMEVAPREETDDPYNRANHELNEVLPEDAAQAYDMKRVVIATADEDSFLELSPNFAPNMLIGFARYGGYACGVVANQPLHSEGLIDSDAAVKAARFVRCCDAFNIPLVTFVDAQGFLPGTAQEHAGIIRHGAKLLYAFAEATVPKVTVITRKAYGGAYCVMGSKHLKGDVNFAWPTAEIAVMGPEAAAEVLYSHDLKTAPDSEALLAKKVTEYIDRFASPYEAARRGYIDDVIYPSETRLRIIRSLIMLENKQDQLPPKKHGNIPL